MKKRKIVQTAAVVSGITLLAGPAGAVEIPKSLRSEEAVARVRPGLADVFAKQELTWGAEIFVRIFKQEAELEVWGRQGDIFRLVRTYPICKYSGNLGPKIREGDRQSPEGFYAVTAAQLNPKSKFHLSFNLGFPNAYDKQWGRTGSFLMVHGDCTSVGCFAMASSPGWAVWQHNRNRPIEEIWTLMEAAFAAGQSAIQVHVFPFRLTRANLARYGHLRWRRFWENLREGYVMFERTRLPPKVTVNSYRYEFSPGE